MKLKDEIPFRRYWQIFISYLNKYKPKKKVAYYNKLQWIGEYPNPPVEKEFVSDPNFKPIFVTGECMSPKAITGWSNMSGICFSGEWKPKQENVEFLKYSFFICLESPDKAINLQILFSQCNGICPFSSGGAP